MREQQTAKGFILWLTGLSGAGKSTLAKALKQRLEPTRAVDVLDGDEVRTSLSRGLGFTREDREENVRRIAYVARRLAHHRVAVLVAAITPYRSSRDEARRLATEAGITFIEVYVCASQEVLIRRDVKGLYTKALAGELAHFTGISDPYEPSESPEVVIHTDETSVEDGVESILPVLGRRGLFAKASNGRHEAVPLPGTRETLEALLSFDTSPAGADHHACARWLGRRLGVLGFNCRLHQPMDGAPAVVEAHRLARGMGGHVVMYGHYDVTPLPCGEPGGDTPPQMLIERNGRWWAQGVSDNKGALAARLVALAQFEHTPALTWFIQGEEETGSSAARRVLSERLPELEADLWLDETGYHDHEDGTLRLIARRIGPGRMVNEPPDTAMQSLFENLSLLSRRWGINARLEVRGLNKVAVSGGCPFNQHLPVGARYLALGINDSQSRIHSANESVPLWTFPLHAEELQVVFKWVEQLALGRA